MTAAAARLPHPSGGRTAYRWLAYKRAVALRTLPCPCPRCGRTMTWADYTAGRLDLGHPDGHGNVQQQSRTPGAGSAWDRSALRLEHSRCNRSHGGAVLRNYRRRGLPPSREW